jgi:hypothetical protein
MKRIQLTQTVHIPDEAYEGEGPVPVATNYAGAVFEVSDELADRLIAESKAIEILGEKEPVGETAAAVQNHFESGE